jgi:hypothetical protein
VHGSFDLKPAIWNGAGGSVIASLAKAVIYSRCNIGQNRLTAAIRCVCITRKVGRVLERLLSSGCPSDWALAPAIDIRLSDPPPQRVSATIDLWRDGHDRRRLIGILMLVFKNHPNRAGADLGSKPVYSVTFFHRLHPYLLWSLWKTWGWFS